MWLPSEVRKMIDTEDPYLSICHLLIHSVSYFWWLTYISRRKESKSNKKYTHGLDKAAILSYRVGD